MNLIELLTPAAERGVQVTIMTNDQPAPPITLRWQFKEFYWGATGTFRGAGFDLRVVDQDGDRSCWTLKRGKEVLASGEIEEWQPYYHFDACLLAAEAALREAVKVRRQAVEREAHGLKRTEQQPR